LIKNETIKARIIEEIEKVNKELAQYEKIKNPQFLSREWSIDKGEMTPKLSLKRKVIMAANADLVNKIYTE
jgi:long-chain acyl-CoA synthetase